MNSSPSQIMVPTNNSPRQRTGARGTRIYSILGRFSLAFILGALIVGFSLARPESFFSMRNFEGIFVNQIVVVFAAIGLMFPLVVGELDLSVGNLVGFSQALVIGLMTLQHLPIPIAIIVTIVACGVVGVVNGLLVVRLGINSLIATLATGTVLYGAVLWYTQGTVLFLGVPKGFLSISGERVAGLPLPIAYGAILVAVVEIALRYLPIGRQIYAVGGNRRASLLTGIAVGPIVIGAFVLTGIACAVGGIIIASRLGSAQPELGPQYLLPAYSAAFLGATTVQPGRFNALGTVIAVYTMAVIIAGLQQIGVPYWAEYIVYGVALASGVALSAHLIRLRDARARRDQLRAFEESR